VGCSACPSDKAALFASAFVPFAAFLLGVFSLMFLVVWQLERLRAMAEPFATALRQSKEFCIWTCLSAQILATASNSTSPGVPGVPSWSHCCMLHALHVVCCMLHAGCPAACNMDAFWFSRVGQRDL
jgi:hypothetical protein